MARVLTNDEKVTLINSYLFKESIKQAVRDAGDYWANHDQAGMTDTLDNKLKWARNRAIGVQIVLNDAYVANQELPVQAIKACKNLQFNLGAAPLNEASLLSSLTANDYESIAGLLMDVFGESVNLVIGGN